MIEAVAKGFFGHDHAILDGGRVVGSIHTRAWGAGANVRVNGHELTFERAGFWAHEFTASRDGVEFAHANGPRRFLHSVEFTHGDRSYELAHGGFFKHEFVIRRQNLRVGTIRATRFGRHVAAETPAEWPLELVVFALWLAIMMWRRRAAVAAAG